MKVSLFKRWLLLILLPVGVISTGAIWNYQAELLKKTGKEREALHKQLFTTSDACISCHTGLITPSGKDLSFGSDWAATMMANSARDPYWHAAVRREVTDHPESQALIEEECSTCHMPMAHYEATYNGKQAEVFTHLPINQVVSRQNLLAADGVSCTTCHQITEEGLGTPESFVGRFAIDSVTQMGQRQVFGPYNVNAGLQNIMHSSSGFIQKQSKHIQTSEVCATCHTLITEALGPDGEVIGELPEQVPYQEWEHSTFVDEKSCQTCHMPVVTNPVPIASIMGEPRAEVSRHTFQGGNFFMLKILNRYRNELGVQATSMEMDAAINRTVDHLQTKSARVQLQGFKVENGNLVANVFLKNLAGHKLPTAYPSRRVWIHFTVKDNGGNILFESGGLRTNGSIIGNDNDEWAEKYEPHYSEITEPEQVQIYESIMVDRTDMVTTGLLTAVRYIKDNRVLPDGFDKKTAGEDIAVHGAAYQDNDFAGGSDQITYRVDIGDYDGPLQVTAEIWYQPIAYRWAQNLVPYKSEETNRFVSYYDAMSGESAVKLATVSSRIQ